MEKDFKKKVIKPLCIYSLAFSMLLPSLTGVVEAASDLKESNKESNTEKIVASQKEKIEGKKKEVQAYKAEVKEANKEVKETKAEVKEEKTKPEAKEELEDILTADEIQEIRNRANSLENGYFFNGNMVEELKAELRKAKADSSVNYEEVKASIIEEAILKNEPEEVSQWEDRADADKISNGNLEVNKFFLGNQTISGKTKLGANRRKKQGKDVVITVTVVRKAGGTDEKTVTIESTNKKSDWSVTLEKKLAVGDKVSIKHVYGGDLDGEIKDIELKELLRDTLENKLKMPTGTVMIEDISSSLVDEFEQNDAFELFKTANASIMNDITSAKFGFESGTLKAWYDITYTDGSTYKYYVTAKKEGDQLKEGIEIKKITERSETPKIAKTYVADGQITINFDKEIAKGSKIGIIKTIDMYDINQFCTDEGACSDGKCKITKSTIEWVSVDAETKTFTHNVDDDFLKYGIDFGVVVKEPGKLNSCKKTKPVIKIPNVGVRDPKKLTDEEKKAIDAAIRKANTTNDGKGVSKLPDWTVNNIPAYIEFDKNGNVKIIDPSTVDGDWKDNYTKFVPKINDDGSIKLQDGKTPAKTVEPKEVLNNLPPIAPKVDLSDDKKNITITPNEADTDAKEVSVTYTGKDGTSKTLTATKGDNGEWTVPNGADGSVDKTTGVITLPTDKVKGGETVNATVKDDGFKEAQQKAEESKIGTLTVPKVKTKAEQVTELGGLDPVSMKKWVEDSLDLKDGVKAKDSTKKADVDKLLEGATFEDATDTARTTDKADTLVGKVKVKFDDGSELVVENQTLYVKNHVLPSTEENVPEGAIDVEVKLGEGVKVEDKDQNTGQVTNTHKGSKETPLVYKTYKVKPGTDLSTYKHPVLGKTIFELIDEKTQDGYADPVWNGQDTTNPKNFVASDTNKVFTATATKTYDVKVVANGGKGNDIKVTKKTGETYTLPAKDTFTPPNDDQEFSGWQVGDDSKNLKKPGENITITKDIEVKAIWKPVEYKVSFKAEGGATGTMTDVTVTKGSEYELPTPTFQVSTDKEFVGWRVGNGTDLKKVGDTIPISGSVKLTAVYSPIAKIKAPIVSVDTNTGNLIITPPKPPAGQEIKSVTVKYKDPTGTEKTVTVEKSSDNWNLVPAATNGESANASSGVITIPRGKYMLDRPVEAFANNKANQKSDVANATPVEVSFDMMNGGKKGVDSLIKIKDQFYGLPAIHELPEYQLIIPDGKEFDGWEIDGVKMAPGQNIQITNNTKIKALWRDKGTSPSLPEAPSPEEYEIPGIKIRDHYTPTFPVYVTVPKTEKVEKAEEVPTTLETHKAYIAGYEDNTLRAEGNLTRAEAAAMVTRLAGLDLSDNTMPAFKDMQKNAWYFRYINAAVKAKMLDADNGMMRPNDKITRAEFAKMLAAIDKENSSVSKFDDIKGHRYEKEINKIYGNNRIEGYEDGSFRPDAYLTRAESAAFLNRMFNRIADKEAYAGLEDKLARFKDFDASKWYYDEMVEATNSHELTRRGKASDKFGRVYEKWTRILPSDVK